MFDDLAMEESSYVMAKVPLLPLAQGKTNITDTYTLTEVNCCENGACKMFFSKEMK